ncbi:MAG: hypothetical protein J0M19_05280 [Sphingomonadales bacterium]|nr:hypothetical protein [Sphingomonadales bacterium]
MASASAMSVPGTVHSGGVFGTFQFILRGLANTLGSALTGLLTSPGYVCVPARLDRTGSITQVTVSASALVNRI